MTDTAVPLPDPIDTDAVTDGAILRPSQLRRVEALKAARSVLENRAGLFSGSKVEEVRSVVDLLTLADWILTGEDPYPDDRVAVLTGSGERIASISTRPGQWTDADNDNMPTVALAVAADDDSKSYPEDALPK